MKSIENTIYFYYNETQELKLNYLVNIIPIIKYENILENRKKIIKENKKSGIYK
jgi:hypothetical protein